MNTLKVLIATFLLVLSAPGLANPVAEREAGELLDSMRVGDVLGESMIQILELQIQKQPEFLPYREVLLEFLNRHISYDVVKPELIRSLLNTFTPAELREVRAFYETSAGRKTIDLLPALFARVGEIGVETMAARQDELLMMIAEHEERAIRDEAVALVSHGIELVRTVLGHNEAIPFREAITRNLSFDYCLWKSEEVPGLVADFCADPKGAAFVSGIRLWADPTLPPLPHGIRFGMSCSEVVEILGPPHMDGEAPCSGKPAYVPGDLSHQLIYVRSLTQISEMLELGFDEGGLSEMRWIME